MILLRSVALAVLLMVLSATPALADPPGPTNYTAVATGIQPAVDGVEARVIGGDSFLQLSVEGHEVVVPGYDGEELYLRFDSNGEVYENRRSQSYYQNQSRYNPEAADRPAEIGADVPPEWVLVSTNGTYAWHDHRIHWMSPNTPPPLADGSGQDVDPSGTSVQRVNWWTEPVPIRVDGQPAGISGELLYHPPASPLPTVLAAVAVLAGALVLGRRSMTAGLAVAVAGPGLLALAVSLPERVGLPAGVQGQPLQLVLPAIALLVAAAAWSARDRSPFALPLAGLAGVPLLGWFLANLAGITAAVVPPDVVPDLASRLVLGAVAGGGLAGVVLGVQHLLFSDALSLDPDAEPSSA